LPKLQALAQRGYDLTQFVEDVDVAFTSLGADVDDEDLDIARECYHRSGASSWGAALYYTGFLGRLPVDVRDWEPFTGLKTKTLAKKLGLSLDELFTEYSAGDNWQLVGPSFLGDRDHHRVIGDLGVAEVRDFLRRIMRIARDNMFATFPEKAPRKRLADWFRREEALVDTLLSELADRPLVDLYHAWLRHYLPPGVKLDRTSSLFACGGRHQGTELLELFVADYDRAAGLYNEALSEAATGLRGLRTRDGELPFFAVMERSGHLVRTPAALDGKELILAGRAFTLETGGRIPMRALADAGVRCLVGKALLLVIQVRLAPGGSPLAMPHRGSLYMPASNRLMEKLAAAGMLPAKLHPIVRVKFGLLERMKSLETIIRLPNHLAPSFGKEEISARELAENYPQVADDARRRLESFRDPALREAWRRWRFPELVRSMEEADRKRAELARAGADPSRTRALWDKVKQLRRRLLERTVRQIARDFQARDIDYYDSRGALWPWSVALGGQRFYAELVGRAEIYTEPVPEGYDVE